MSSESTVNVCIKDAAGNTTEIAMIQTGTVRNLKEKYSELHTDITVIQQKLIILSSANSQSSRIALQDYRTISSYDISPNGIGSRENPVLLFIFNSK